MTQTLRQIKEAARARGLNAEWLPETIQQKNIQVSPAPGNVQVSPTPGQVSLPPTGLNPEVKAMMDAIGQYQRSTPAYIPFPGGTPTLGGRQLAEQQRQFDESMAFNREQWLADQAYRNAQLAAAQAAQEAAARPWNQLRTIAEDAVRQGLGFDTVSKFIDLNYRLFGDSLDKTDEAKRVALMYYENALMPRLELATPQDIDHRQEYQRMWKSLQEARDILTPPESEWEHVSGNIFRNKKTGQLVTQDPILGGFVPVELPQEEGTKKGTPSLPY